MGLDGEMLGLCDPWENLEDMLDSHELRRVVPGEEGDLENELTVGVFSVELLLEGVRPGIGLGGVGVCSLVSFCVSVDFFTSAGLEVWLLEL